MVDMYTSLIFNVGIRTFFTVLVTGDGCQELRGFSKKCYRLEDQHHLYLRPYEEMTEIIETKLRDVKTLLIKEGLTTQD